MKILMVNNEREDFSRGGTRWEGHLISYSTLGFEDIVKGLWTRNYDIQIDTAALGKLAEETHNADVVYCESPEALLLWYFMSRKGGDAPPFVIEDEHLLQSVTRLGRWLGAVYGGSPLEVFLSDRRNVWMHHVGAHREKYVAAGIQPTRLMHLPCSAYLISLLSPDTYKVLRKGDRKPGKKAIEQFGGSILCAGFNRRDTETFAAATRGLPYKLRVIGSRDEDSAKNNNAMQWHDFMPQSEYLDALAAAAVVVVPMKYDEFSGGENTATFAMALGTPVVATSTQALAEIIDDGKTGLLVPRGDAAAMRDSLKMLMRDEAYRGRLSREAKKAEHEISERSRKTLIDAFGRIQL